MGLVSPFFFASELKKVPNPVQSIVATTVEGLGYELVDLELAGHGLMRVFIDLPPGARPDGSEASADESLGAQAPRVPAAQARAAIALEDCERVSRQLTRVFEVEGIDYARLEVSSPGLDRPLKREADFERFAGSEITLRLKQPIEGRRNFEGPLRALGQGRFELEFKGKDGPQVLGFVLDDVDRARLVPKVVF